MQLVLHGAAAVEVADEEGGGRETHAGAAQDALPQPRVEELGAGRLAELLQQDVGPGGGTHTQQGYFTAQHALPQPRVEELGAGRLAELLQQDVRPRRTHRPSTAWYKKAENGGLLAFKKTNQNTRG